MCLSKIEDYINEKFGDDSDEIKLFNFLKENHVDVNCSVFFTLDEIYDGNQMSYKDVDAAFGSLIILGIIVPEASPEGIEIKFGNEEEMFG